MKNSIYLFVYFFVFLTAVKTAFSEGEEENEVIEEKSKLSLIDTMALPVMEFQDQGFQVRKIFALKSTYPKEIIEF